MASYAACNLGLGHEVRSVTDWQQRYIDGDTPWEKGEAAPPLREMIDRLGVGIFGKGEVWVPGCGLGHDVRFLASHGLEVLGLDLAPAALEAALARPQVNRERYELADFLDTASLVDRRAGAIWEHTCFCAIQPDRRGDYARSAAAVLAPGGILAGVFFLRPHDPGEEAMGPPFASTIESIDSCFSPWFERIEAWRPEAAYPGREGREWLAVYKRLT